MIPAYIKLPGTECFFMATGTTEAYSFYTFRIRYCLLHYHWSLSNGFSNEFGQWGRVCLPITFLTMRTSGATFQSFETLRAVYMRIFNVGFMRQKASAANFAMIGNCGCSWRKIIHQRLKKNESKIEEKGFVFALRIISRRSIISRGSPSSVVVLG